MANDHNNYENIFEYILHGIGGLTNVIAFYNAWSAARHRINHFCCISYENLQTDTAGAMEKMLRALDFQLIDKLAVHRAVEFCRFDNMKKMEEEDTFDDFRLRPHRWDDPESYKVRRGLVGGYRLYLDLNQIQILNGIINENLSGYFKRLIL